MRAFFSFLLNKKIWAICIFIPDVYIVQQQPNLAENEQPTIAIITVNYYEKLAVDAIMTDKITFVRRKPEGILFFLLN